MNVAEETTAFIFRQKSRKDGELNISSVFFRTVFSYSGGSCLPIYISQKTVMLLQANVSECCGPKKRDVTHVLITFHGWCDMWN